MADHNIDDVFNEYEVAENVHNFDDAKRQKQQKQPGRDNPEQGQSESPDVLDIVSDSERFIYPEHALRVSPLIHDACEEVSLQVGAPFEMVAMNALGFASAVAQGLAKARRKTRLVCSLSLYQVILAPSGDRKTAVDNMMSAPVRAWVKRHLKKMGPVLDEYQADYDSWKSVIEGLKSAIKAEAKKAKTGTETDELKQLRKELQKRQKAKPKAPIVVNPLYTDVTIQGLLDELLKCPTGFVTTEEGMTFFGGAALDSASLNTALSHFNSLYSGKEIDLTRVSKGRGMLENVVLSICIAIQTEPFIKLMEKTGGAIRGSGFMGRFLMGETNSLQGTRIDDGSPEPESTPAMDRLSERFVDLLDLQEEIISEHKQLKRTVLDLSDGAKERLRQFYNECELSLLPGGDGEEIAAEVNKAAETASRVAGVLHIIENGLEGEISEAFIDSACKIVQWHLSESRRFMVANGLAYEFPAALRVSKRMANRVRKTGEVRYTMQGIQQYFKVEGAKTRNELLPVIDVLLAANHLIGHDGGVYIINPTPGLLRQGPLVGLSDGLKDTGEQSPGIYSNKASETTDGDSGAGKADCCQRVLIIDAGEIVNEYEVGADPWHLLNNLRLLPEDKSYLHGAVNILQLPDPMLYAFLATYRGKWEAASHRCTNPNGKTNAGRRAANNWILYGAKPFIQWEDSS